MRNSEIRAMSAIDAAHFLRVHVTLWRAVFRAGKNGVKHTWIQMGGKGPLLNQGETLCGRTMLPTTGNDWENIYIKAHCSTCETKLALLKEQAHISGKSRGR